MSDNDYSGPNNRRREQWHLKREFNLAHLFTTLSAVVSCGIFLANQDKRLALLENAQVQQVRIDAGQDKALESATSAIREDLKDIKRDLRQLVMTQSHR